MLQTPKDKTTNKRRKPAGHVWVVASIKYKAGQNNKDKRSAKSIIFNEYTDAKEYYNDIVRNFLAENNVESIKNECKSVSEYSDEFTANVVYRLTDEHGYQTTGFCIKKQNVY